MAQDFNNGAAVTQTGDFQCSSCTLSYSGGGSHTYSGTQTCIGCEVAITGAYSFFGNGVGSLVYQSTSMLITASAYFQIALTFATCALDISNGGYWESSQSTDATDGSITLNNGRARCTRASSVTTRSSHVFTRVVGFVQTASSAEFGCDGLVNCEFFATRFAWRSVFGLAQTIFRVTSVASSQLTVLCGGNDGDLSVGSGAAVQVDLTNCSNSNQTWTDTGVVGDSVAQAVGTLDLSSGAYLQLLAVTSSSLAMYASGLGSFDGAYELDSDESGALSSTTVLVIKVDNSSVSCPSTTCNVTDCPSSYTCACSWSLTQGDVNSSNYYCVSSYSQSITGGTGDDSDEGLYGLLALLIIPIACLGALAFMKFKASQEPALLVFSHPADPAPYQYYEPFSGTSTTSVPQYPPKPYSPGSTAPYF